MAFLFSKFYHGAVIFQDTGISLLYHQNTVCRDIIYGQCDSMKNNKLHKPSVRGLQIEVGGVGGVGL